MGIESDELIRQQPIDPFDKEKKGAPQVKPPVPKQASNEK